MNLDIITPEREVYSGEVTGVQMPGVTGSFEVLENHAPLISALQAGKVTINTSKGKVIIEITGGFVEVLNNKVVLLAESAKDAA